MADRQTQQDAKANLLGREHEPTPSLDMQFEARQGDEQHQKGHGKAIVQTRLHRRGLANPRWN